MRFLAAGLTHIGGRAGNEDAFHAGGRLIAVADGVGGAPAGEVASRLAVDTIASLIDADPLDAVRQANAAVRSHPDPDTAGMASTLAFAALWPGPSGWVVRGAHVGDSITFVNGVRTTQGHTLAAELVAAGHLTPEEATRHPHRAALVRAVGLDGEIEPDLWTRPATIGDRYVLSSDGLTDALGDTVEDRLAELAAVSPKDCAAALVRLALAADARDNVTVVVADVIAN
ncbi:Serine/threonine phosphatase PPP [Alloactinosynnema sp. L-07]|uniref:PP2C family protein-serine/threonine phosphatase n=1 Tax=Alloactinosynnema sp. L-07 TaxID=1653480 RepID=UPI00065EFF00|nr:PP2C family serine/threonine-protein phosphatase [Alloactinosynnema sp. L-07]CRK61765.1 Serine/threonine phosphatase PPP [Alloactinosynnema sp. L-07]